MREAILTATEAHKEAADCARMRILVAFTTLRMRVLGPLTGQQVQSSNSFRLAKIETKKKSSKSLHQFLLTEDVLHAF